MKKLEYRWPTREEFYRTLHRTMAVVLGLTALVSTVAFFVYLVLGKWNGVFFFLIAAPLHTLLAWVFWNIDAWEKRWFAWLESRLAAWWQRREERRRDRSA